MLELAAASLTFDGFDDIDFVNTFQTARKAGYHNIEFNCWYPQTLTPQKMRELKKRCEQAQLHPIAIHVSSIAGGNREALTMNLCHKIYCIEAARELGCRRVCFTGTDRNSAGGIEDVITVLKHLMPVAEANDVLICLENHCANRLETIGDYRQILEAVPSPNLGICIDTGHFDASGIQSTEVLYTFPDRVLHIHLKENNGFGVKKFCRFGEGTTDNVKLIREAYRYGYSGYLTVEISPEIGENGGNADFLLDDLKKPVELFSQLLSELCE